MYHASVGQLRAVSVAETLALGPGIVDLWYYFYGDMNDAELLTAHATLLTPTEREQHRKFQFERDRRLYLATRSLVRTVLSSYAAVAPTDWRFTVGEHGKPYIDSPTITPLIHFNLANTPGLVVCVVSIAHRLIGVDAERTDRQVEVLELAERYFSPSEIRSLRALPDGEQSQRFFAYWTLKESYIKARGLGLALPLDQFSFLVDDEIRIVFDPRLVEDSTRWRFSLLDAPPHHTVAVGAETGGIALSLRATPVVPLRVGHADDNKQ